MATPGGHWVAVGDRQDWVPNDQPPSPDGTLGLWHVLTDVGGGLRWEWHPAPADWREPDERTPRLGKGLIVGVSTVVVLLTLGLIGVIASRQGGRPSRADWDACYQERLQDVRVEGAAPVRAGCRKVFEGNEQDVREAIVDREFTYFTRLMLAQRDLIGMEQRELAVEVGLSVCSNSARTRASSTALERQVLDRGVPAAFASAVVANAFQYLCPEKMEP